MSILKLNMDCVRSILLELEKLDYGDSILVFDLEKSLSKYPTEVVRYTCFKLYEANLIFAVPVDDDESVLPLIAEILDITYSGHQFLAKVRDNDRWSAIKKGLSENIRDFSLSAITAIADGMTSAAINAFFAGQLGP